MVAAKLCVFQNLICWLLPTSPLSHLDDVYSSGWPTRTHPALSPGAILGHMSLPRDLAAKGTSGEVPEGIPSPWVLSAADLLSQLQRPAQALPDPFLLLIRTHTSGNHLTALCKPVVSNALNPL